jgi:hypothetical protein
VKLGEAAQENTKMQMERGLKQLEKQMFKVRRTQQEHGAVSTSLNAASLDTGSSEAMPAIGAAVSAPPASIAAGSTEAIGEPHSLAGSSLVGSDPKP